MSILANNTCEIVQSKYAFVRRKILKGIPPLITILSTQKFESYQQRQKYNKSHYVDVIQHILTIRFTVKKAQTCNCYW